MSADRVTLADVLDPHTVTYPVAAGWKCCLCGWEGVRVGDHLADIIQHHLTALAGDARVREAVAYSIIDTSGDTYANPLTRAVMADIRKPSADAAVAAFLGCVG